MIEELTAEQTAGLEEYKLLGYKIGQDTAPINKELVEISWNKLYAIMNFKNPRFIYCQSPLQAEIIINVLQEREKSKASLEDIFANHKINKISNYSYGQHDIGWILSFKYLKDFKLLPDDNNFKIFDIWYDIATSCGWCYTFKNAVFVCEKPCAIYFNREGQLHKDGAKAVEYSDGFGLYMLNGISVPDWVVTKKAEDITVEQALNESNADVQREIIRKIGAERLVDKMELVDEYCEERNQESGVVQYIFNAVGYKPKLGCHYKLMKMVIGENINRRYLIFEHASIPGVFYAKPVPIECTRAIDARAWILSIIEKEEFNKYTVDELIKRLPNKVS